MLNLKNNDFSKEDMRVETVEFLAVERPVFWASLFDEMMEGLLTPKEA